MKAQAEAKARAFYRSCMATRAPSRPDSLRRFRELAEEVGGWSSSAAPNASQWYWADALQRVHRLGAWPLFRVVVDVDERDPTARYILKVSAAGECLLLGPLPSHHSLPPGTSSRSVLLASVFC